MTPAERAERVVMVCEAQTVGSIAVIRALGLAGYQVLACAPLADALGFRSRHTRHREVHPPYENGAEFTAWLWRVLDQYRVACILPSEGFLLATRAHFGRLSPRYPLSRDEALVYRGMSKHDLFGSFATAPPAAGLGDHLPGFLQVDSAVGLPATIGALRYPVYVKTDGCHARAGAGGYVQRAADATELVRLTAAAERDFRCVLLQEHVPGRGVGAFLLRWNGTVLARFMHRRLHEVPHTGGVSSFRESWWHEAILADAERRLAALDWQGVGMLEYRWDEQTDDFRLLEFNGRFWGSLHLALYAGVDFPTLLVDAFFGSPRPAPPPRLGVRCRLTFPKEVQYVRSCLKDPDLGWSRKLAVLLEFGLLGLDPRVKSDMLYGHDAGLYLPMVVRSVRDFLR